MFQLKSNAKGNKFQTDCYPIMLGSATNWKPYKMLDALNFTILRLTKQLEARLGHSNTDTGKHAIDNIQKLRVMMMANLNGTKVLKNNNH